MILQAGVPVLCLGQSTLFSVFSLTVSSLEKANAGTYSLFLCVWPTVGSVGVVSIRVGWNDLVFLVADTK